MILTISINCRFVRNDSGKLNWRIQDWTVDNLEGILKYANLFEMVLDDLNI